MTGDMMSYDREIVLKRAAVGRRDRLKLLIDTARLRPDTSD
jgi:hypothetical protein